MTEFFTNLIEYFFKINIEHSNKTAEVGAVRCKLVG
jgi:hypothetical protein